MITIAEQIEYQRERLACVLVVAKTVPKSKALKHDVAIVRAILATLEAAQEKQ